MLYGIEFLTDTGKAKESENAAKSVLKLSMRGRLNISTAGELTALLEAVIKGDTVREVLNYVQFSSDALVTQLRRDVEAALREGRIGYEESGRLLRFYEEGLHGYTYLEDAHER